MNLECPTNLTYANYSGGIITTHQPKLEKTKDEALKCKIHKKSAWFFNVAVRAEAYIEQTPAGSFLMLCYVIIYVRRPQVISLIQ